MVKIRQRKDGRYEARPMIHGRRYSIYGKNEAEVRAKLVELQRQLDDHRPPPPRLTVRQLVERWLATEERRWKPRTVADYRRLAERWVYPAIGQVRLAQLTPDRLQRLVDRIPGRAASQTYRLLHRCFAVAVRWSYLADNPCDRVSPPGYRPTRPVLPDHQGLQRLFHHCLVSRDEYAPLVGLVLVTGMRLGEVLALRWDDVDLARGLVSITRSGQRIAGQWVETEPKTRAGRRVISLGPLGVQLLRRQKAIVAKRKLAAGPAWTEHGLVFPNTTGRPLCAERVNTAVQRLCRQVDLPRLTVHQLRHGMASLALQAGVPLPEVSCRLGHANPAITARIYSHAIGDGRQVAEAIERVLRTSGGRD